MNTSEQRPEVRNNPPMKPTQANRPSQRQNMPLHTAAKWLWCCIAILCANLAVVQQAHAAAGVPANVQVNSGGFEIDGNVVVTGGPNSQGGTGPNGTLDWNYFFPGGAFNSAVALPSPSPDAHVYWHPDAFSSGADSQFEGGDKVDHYYSTNREADVALQP